MNKKILKFIFILIASNIISGCSRTPEKKGLSFFILKNFTSSEQKKAMTEEYIEDENGKIVKDKKIKKLAVISFQIEFISKTTANLIAYQNSQKTPDTDVYYQLTNLTNESMQKIIDEAYENIVFQVKESGFEVVDKEQIISSNAYKKLISEKTPLKSKSWLEPKRGESLTVAPLNMALYYTKNEHKSLSGGLTHAFKPSKGKSPQNYEAELGEELGVDALVKVKIVLGFVSLKARSNVDKTKITQMYNLTISSNGSYFKIYTFKKEKNRNPFTGTEIINYLLDDSLILKLKKPMISNLNVVEGTKEITSKSTKTAQGVVTAFSDMSGGDTVSKIKEYEASADNKTYISAAIDYLKVFNELMILKLRKLK